MNFLRAFAVIWGCGALALGAWLSYMVYDNVPPYVWDEGPPLGQSFASPDPVMQGAVVTINWRILKINRLCPANLQRFFYDGNSGELVSTLDTTEASRSVKIGDTRIPRSFRLPPNLPAKTDYQALACFECNIYQATVRPLCIPTPKVRINIASQ